MAHKTKRLSDYSAQSIVNDIRRVAKKLGEKSFSYREFRKHSRVCDFTITKRLGSWNNALKKAGLPIHRKRNVSNEELLTEIERIWNQFGREPKRQEMDQLGEFSTSTYAKRFGSWYNALITAGFPARKRRSLSDEELFAEIERIWNQLGKQPTYAEMKHHGKIGIRTYEKRFGRWLKAVEAFKKWRDMG